jgi:hypothetical protein
MNKCRMVFVEVKSCVTNLFRLHDYIGRTLDNGEQVGTVYLDMSKAFDRISHVKLFSKLDNYRFSGSLLKCFQSYLTGRRQRVIIFGVTSNTVPILSGPLSCFLRIQYMIQSKTQVETVNF